MQVVDAHGDAAESEWVGRKRSVTFDSRLVDRSDERTNDRYSESDDGSSDAENMKRRAATGHPRQRRRRTSHASRGRVVTFQPPSHREVMRSTAPAEKPSRLTEVMKGLACLILLLLLTPIMTSLMVDRTYFDALAKCSPGEECNGRGFWKFCQSVHNYAFQIVSYCNIHNVPLLTQAAPLPEPGFIEAVVDSIYRFVSSVFGALAFWK